MTDRYKIIFTGLGFSCVSCDRLTAVMNEETEPEAELELIGTNFFKILSEECLLHISNSIFDTYRHRQKYQDPVEWTQKYQDLVEWTSTSYKSLGRLSVCCQDFNTLLIYNYES
eukprot:SAG11_NODE_7240_length_1173_cov_34.214153_1_plen_114_part_00